MLKFIGSLIAPIATPLIIAGVALLSLSGMSLYDRWIDDPAVAREARREYVHIAEKTALEAQLAEVKRQSAAYQSALIANTSRVIDLEHAQEAAKAQAAKDRTAYEQKLRDEGRECPLTDADIEWLQRPNR